MPEFDKKPVRSTNNEGFKPNVSDDFISSGRRAAVRRKEGVLLGLLRGLFPWKGDRPGDIARKIIFLGSLSLIVYAAVTLIDFYVVRDMKNTQEQQELLSIRDNYEGEEMVPVLISPENSPGTQGEDKAVEVIGEYLGYYEKNEDFIGFLNIYPIVQYPVYQSDDNDFYLNHNHDKIPTINGTIFADYEGVYTQTTRPHNNVIYGHNLITNHLFQPLMVYRDSQNSAVDGFSFLKEHPVIRFDTLYERGYYKIFSIFQSNVKSYQGEVFDYWNYIYFDSKNHFDNFIADCLDRSFYYTNVDLQYGDELIMLSTCDFSMFANNDDSSVRLVIAARRVRDDEYREFTQSEKDAFIDNRGRDSQGQVRRKMFEAYYNTFAPAGWAGRTWDSSYIKDFEG